MSMLFNNRGRAESTSDEISELEIDRAASCRYVTMTQ
jgi:hypothetical protein